MRQYSLASTSLQSPTILKFMPMLAYLHSSSGPSPATPPCQERVWWWWWGAWPPWSCLPSPSTCLSSLIPHRSQSSITRQTCPSLVSTLRPESAEIFITLTLQVVAVWPTSHLVRGLKPSLHARLMGRESRIVSLVGWLSRRRSAMETLRRTRPAWACRACH